jgi:hypothetical protein
MFLKKRSLITFSKKKVDFALRKEQPAKAVGLMNSLSSPE